MSGILSHLGLGELLAIGSSLSYSVTMVCLRQGMRSSSPLAATLFVNITVGTVGMVAALLRQTLQTSSPVPILWFMAAGFVGAGLGKLLYCIGIERMGVSRSTPIQSSTPIWGVLFAMATLGERPGAPVWLGTLCIVGGVSLLSLAEGEEGNGGGWFQHALIFPLASSMLFALPPVFMKFAFAHQRTPLVAVAVVFWAGMAILLAGKPLLLGRGKIRADRRALLWVALAGVFNFLTAIMYYTALAVGDVSTVLPLSRLTPLWVVLISYLFLGRIERITERIVLAAALVVAGGVLITAFR
ncbi:MAG: DMT family transporter [Nitrospinota bacterium]